MEDGRREEGGVTVICGCGGAGAGPSGSSHSISVFPTWKGKAEVYS